MEWEKTSALCDIVAQLKELNKILRDNNKIVAEINSDLKQLERTVAK